MENFWNLIEQMVTDVNLPLDEIPNIDLYMDQVIQLFENKFAETKRKDEDKVLTKTMINNYAKGKLIFPIKNKKYSKEHLILISLIYHLKGALSINDIKMTLEGINKRILKEEIDLGEFYNSYLNLAGKNATDFKEDLENRVSAVKKEIIDDQEGSSSYLEQVLMIAALAHMSSLYRKAAEKLVDSIILGKEEKRPK